MNRHGARQQRGNWRTSEAAAQDAVVAQRLLGNPILDAREGATDDGCARARAGVRARYVTAQEAGKSAEHEFRRPRQCAARARPAATAPTVAEIPAVGIVSNKIAGPECEMEARKSARNLGTKAPASRSHGVWPVKKMTQRPRARRARVLQAARVWGCACGARCRPGRAPVLHGTLSVLQSPRQPSGPCFQPSFRMSSRALAIAAV